MTSDAIVADFRQRVCEQVDLESEGIGRYRVLTPFEFDDGDRLVVVLKRQGAAWLLTDEGHTEMRLSYDIDPGALHKGTRGEIIRNALNVFSVQDRDGEYVLPVPEGQFGDALFSFVQAILRVADVSYLSRRIPSGSTP